MPIRCDRQSYPYTTRYLVAAVSSTRNLKRLFPRYRANDHGLTLISQSPRYELPQVVSTWAINGSDSASSRTARMTARACGSVDSNRSKSSSAPGSTSIAIIYKNVSSRCPHGAVRHGFGVGPGSFVGVVPILGGSIDSLTPRSGAGGLAWSRIDSASLHHPYMGIKRGDRSVSTRR